MGVETEELRIEIEQTRSDMSGTLEAIGDRVTPSRMVERKKNRMMQGVRSFKDRMMGTAADAQDSIEGLPDTLERQTKGAPMVAGGIAFGLGFLVAAAFPASDTEKRASQKVMDTIEPAKEQLMESGREMAEHLKEPVKEAASSVKDAATEGVQSVTSTATGSTAAGSNAAGSPRNTGTASDRKSVV